MVHAFQLYEHVLFLNYPKLPKHVHKCLYAKFKIRATVTCKIQTINECTKCSKETRTRSIDIFVNCEHIQQSMQHVDVSYHL